MIRKMTKEERAQQTNDVVDHLMHVYQDQGFVAYGCAVWCWGVGVMKWMRMDVFSDGGTDEP